MRTDWAGSSMRVDPIREEYAGTVGAMAAVHGPDSTAASDPAKVADLVLRVAELPEPPVRLLAGPDAYAYAAAAAAGRCSCSSCHSSPVRAQWALSCR
jgi:hypothetical protein